MNFRLTFTFFILVLFVFFRANAQLKQLYKDTDEDNELRKICFYTKSEGYIAFKDWIGYTTDGGTSFIRKYITNTNVNYNGYAVNITFGFAISGVTAFDKNTIIVYGDYGLVPAILYSADQGNTFKLVYHQQSNDLKFSHIVDMIFPENGSVGFAIDEDRILKTVDKGITWTVVYIAFDSYFKDIQKVGANYLSVVGRNKIVSSSNWGIVWAQMNLPSGFSGNIRSASSLSTTKTWLNYENNSGYVYYTGDGGDTWELKNNATLDPARFEKMFFLDDNTAYALGDSYNVYKTTNGGKNWEALPRDINFTYLGYSHYDMQVWDASQFWVGGGYGLLESTNNGGGIPIPKPIFIVDKISLPTDGTISLVNYSKTGYTYKWFRNDVLFSTSYHASYQRNGSIKDIIKLEIDNGVRKEIMTQEVSLPPLITISAFTPKSAGSGEKLTIEGSNFTGITKVTIGGSSASFTVVSPTLITVTVGSGASGDIQIFGTGGIGKISGFTFIPPPSISSFSPGSALPGSEILITGSNFENVREVKFGSTAASSFKVNSKTSLTAVVGPGTSGKISVVTSGGTAQLDGFIVLPAITSFFPKSGTINEVITISGTGFEGVNAIDIGGVPVKSFAVKSATSIVAIAGTSGDGNITISKDGGTATLGSFTFYNAPVITSFSPLKALPGKNVEIYGSNFSTVPGNNIVYFGGVRAVVEASTETRLTVKVPVSAMHSPISVTYHNLTAYSTAIFSPTFDGVNAIAGTPFTEEDIEYTTYPTYGTTGDYDNDGKIDIVLPYPSNEGAGTSGFAVLINNGTKGTIAFRPKITFGLGRIYNNISSADIDGDGKLDIITSSDDYSELLVFRNTSAAGQVKFDPGVKVTNGRAGSMLISDLDFDGKPEIIVANSIFKNSSSIGVISFSDRVNIAADGNCDKIADFDNDGKPDLAFVSFNSGKITFLTNNSAPGSLSFGAKKEVIVPYPRNISLGDFDNDGKLDFALLFAWNQNFGIYKNQSSVSAIDFGARTELPTEDNPLHLRVDDLDGDGQADIVVNVNDKLISVYKNTSTAGVIGFAERINQTLKHSFVDIYIADYDGDGRSDVVGGTQNDTKIKLLRNVITTSPFIRSFSPLTGVKGTDVTISGLNFNGATSVSFGGSEALSFTVIDATRISAKVADGASGEIVVTNAAGRGSKSGFSFGISPKIVSFSPKSGPLKTIVTITGSGFNVVPENNIVYFGHVKAKVLTATNSTLTVEAPTNNSHENVSVTAGNLTAYSSFPFVSTYPNGPANFDKNTFSNVLTLPEGARSGALSDVDGDGKLDIIADSYADVLSVHRNTGDAGKINFAAPKSYNHSPSADSYKIADFDGDGKKDIMFNNYKTKSITIFKNNSTPGVIDLDLKIDLPGDYRGVSVCDVDQDGRPDVVGLLGKLVIFRNTSTPNEIRFEKALPITIPDGGNGLVCADFDNDGKEDIMMLAGYPHTLVQMRNLSSPGLISFVKTTEVPLEAGYQTINKADLDNDGKIDIVLKNLETSKVNIYRNMNTGEFSKNDKVELSSGSNTLELTIADLDGDNKMDLAFGGVSLFKNISTNAKISFNPEASVSPAMESGDIIGDLDGDGQPELVIIGNGLFILKNQINKPFPEITSFSPKNATVGQSITITGKNFREIKSVEIGNFAAQSFTINSPTSITAVVGQGSSGQIKVTGTEGTGVLDGFIFIPQPVIESFIPTISSDNYAFSIRGYDFTGATAVKFGGVPVRSFRVDSPSEISGVLGKPASGNVEVTTPIGTAKLAGYIYIPKPTVTANGPTTIKKGDKLVLTANTGTNYIYTYRWFRNGNELPGETGPTCIVTGTGDYYVVLTYMPYVINSEPIQITAIGDLSITNFKIRVGNETCNTSNNGSITITAVQSLKYTATISGPAGYTKTLKFTYDAFIEALSAGNYSVCLTADEIPDYKRCFDVVITEPKDLVLYSSIVNNDQTVTLIMDGADTYNIELNGQHYKTSTDRITLPLAAGDNRLKISSDLICQAPLEKIIKLQDAMKVYPNPFDRILNIRMPINVTKAAVKVDIFDLIGRKVYTQNSGIVSEILPLDLSDLSSGTYLLKVTIDNTVIQSKIIKK